MLELQSAVLALQHFLPWLHGFDVIVQMDSTVAYINQQGRLGFPPICKLAAKLWEWAHPPIPLPQGSARARSPKHGG